MCILTGIATPDTGLTEDLVIRHLYNLIRWHIFGDLERMVELGRDLLVKGKGLGGQKRALKELNINIAGVKRTKMTTGNVSEFALGIPAYRSRSLFRPSSTANYLHLSSL